MVTEARRYPTEEETREGLAEIARLRKELDDAVIAGIGATTLTTAERRGVEMVVDYVFSDFNEDRRGDWPQKLAGELSGDRLLAKFLGVWYIEGSITDWKVAPEGILGRALDDAAAMLRPYLRDGDLD